jgi:hypothetical protein
LATTVTNQSFVHEEIKSRLNSWNTFYHFVQSCLPVSSEDLKNKIYKTTILNVVLHKCETWPLTLREEHRLRLLECRVLRRLFGPRGREGGREGRRKGLEPG